jgi:hypothetical protein
VATAETPEIIECRLRLHVAHPTGDPSGEPTWAEWSTTVVGEPVTFQARVLTKEGAWNGPLPPGADVSSPHRLDDPWWTVFLPDGSGVAVLSGQVGRPLAIGETFSLAPAVDGLWTNGVVFEGVILFR